MYGSIVGDHEATGSGATEQWSLCDDRVQEKIPYNPIHYYACRMQLHVFEDNRNSRRYGIYTLLITTYCMNKRGFLCAILRPVVSLILFFPTSIRLAFSPPYYPGSLPIFPFFLVPLQVSNPLSFAYLTSLSSGPLHYDDQLRIAPRKRTFILQFQKIYIAIYLFICLKHASRRTKTCIGSLVSFVCSSLR